MGSWLPFVALFGGLAMLYVLWQQVQLRRQAERDLRYYQWNEWRKTQENSFSYRNDEEKKWARELWESDPDYLWEGDLWQGPDGLGFPDKPVHRVGQRKE